MSSYTDAMIGMELVDAPDLLRCDLAARHLHLIAIVWSKAHLTDGEIPRHMLPHLVRDHPDPMAAAEALVAAGVWEAIDDGWRIPIFLDTQWDKATVKRKRDLARQRFVEWQERQPAKAKTNGRATRGKRVVNGQEPTRPEKTREGTQEGRLAGGSRPEAGAGRSPADEPGGEATVIPSWKPRPIHRDTWRQLFTESPGTNPDLAPVQMARTAQRALATIPPGASLTPEQHAQLTAWIDYAVAQSRRPADRPTLPAVVEV